MRPSCSLSPFESEKTCSSHRADIATPKDAIGGACPSACICRGRRTAFNRLGSSIGSLGFSPVRQGFRAFPFARRLRGKLALPLFLLLSLLCQISLAFFELVVGFCQGVTSCLKRCVGLLLPQ